MSDGSAYLVEVSEPSSYLVEITEGSSVIEVGVPGATGEQGPEGPEGPKGGPLTEILLLGTEEPIPPDAPVPCIIFRPMVTPV